MLLSPPPFCRSVEKEMLSLLSLVWDGSPLLTSETQGPMSLSTSVVFFGTEIEV